MSTFSLSTRSAALAVIALLAVPRVAAADDVRDCATAYEQTQRLQQKNELISAIEAADKCAKPVCPAVLRDDCTKWSAELTKKLPTLTLHVRGADGCSRPEALVSVDGPFKKDGPTIVLDPGTHEMTVLDPTTNQSRKESLNMVPTERRDIEVDFAPAGAVCPRPQESTPIGKVPTISLIAGSVGLGFVLLGGTLGIIGASKRGDLDDCKPSCSDDRVDSVRPFFIAGDVFAAVGVVGMALGAISYFMLQPKKPPTATGWYFGPKGVGGTF